MSHYLDELDPARIERAITAAELRTSGEIRVVLLRGAVDDPVAAAEREFHRLEMHETAERNAVLIAVAPDAHRFALFGDAGVHERCGEAFWREVAAAMEQQFRAGRHTDAIVNGIERTGELLAREFPRRGDDRNELSNELVSRPPVV